MAIKQCVICGGEFDARGKVCSEHCRKEKQRRLSRESRRRIYDSMGEERREKERAKCRLWKQNNRAHVQKYMKQWRGENKDKIRESSKLWRENNHDRVISAKRAWIARNKDKIRAQARASHDRWRKRNPNYNRLYYMKNAEAAKERARRWKIEAVAAHRIVCDIQKYGLEAFSPSFKRPEKRFHKPRVRVRSRDHASEKRYVAKRYAALLLVREMKEKGLEALL